MPSATVPSTSRPPRRGLRHQRWSSARGTQLCPPSRQAPHPKQKKHVGQKSGCDRVNNRALSPLVSRIIGTGPTPKNSEISVLSHRSLSSLVSHLSYWAYTPKTLVYALPGPVNPVSSYRVTHCIRNYTATTGLQPLVIWVGFGTPALRVRAATPPRATEPPLGSSRSPCTGTPTIATVTNLTHSRYPHDSDRHQFNTLQQRTVAETLHPPASANMPTVSLRNLDPPHSIVENLQ